MAASISTRTDADAGARLDLAPRHSARLGVTTFLPTLITAAEARPSSARLSAIAEARRADPLVAHAVPFVHVEGPILAAEDGPRGAHPRAHVRPPDLAEFERWQRAARRARRPGDAVAAYPETPAFIAALTAQRRARQPRPYRRDAGARSPPRSTPARVLSTHLGNGARGAAAAAPEFHLGTARRGPADRHLHRRRPSPARRHADRRCCAPRGWSGASWSPMPRRWPACRPAATAAGRRRGGADADGPARRGRHALSGRGGALARRRGGGRGAPGPDLAGRRPAHGHGQSGPLRRRPPRQAPARRAGRPHAVPLAPGDETLHVEAVLVAGVRVR